MGFKDFHHKLKGFRLRKLINGDAGKKKKEAEFGKRPSWMVPVSHGYHVVEDRSFRAESKDESDSDPDSVVVQREQIGVLEVWFFGVFNARIGDIVTKNMQSHLFDKKPKEALVDAPDMVRCQMNFKRLSLTDITIDIKRVPKKKTLIAAMEAADVKNKWENSSWGRKLIVQKRRAALNDFDRFKLMLAKIKRGGLIRKELAKLKKQNAA